MGIKILFVDDTKMIRKFGEMALTAGGYTPLIADDGRTGLEFLAREHGNIKLVMTDWNMPGMDGYTLLLNIKKNDLYKHIPVVMITSEADKSHINQALSSGAADYIIKPFVNEDLIAMVHKILGE
jgi:two-component system, chemotaxis family, chemotaxis protein CheY